MLKGINISGRSSTQQSPPKQAPFAEVHGHDTVPTRDICQLPIELWIQILEMLLGEPGIPYYDCNVCNFPIYQVLFGSSARIETEVTAFCNNYRSMRLVCRTWMRIVGPTTKALVKGIPTLEPAGLKKLAIWSDAEKTLIWPHWWNNRSFWSQLTTLVLADVLNGSIYYLPADLLIFCSGELQTLRSIYLDHKGRDIDFWHRLTTVFPLLVSLTFTGVSGDAILNSEKLEILDIEWNDRIEYHLPSLKHCSLRHVSYNAEFVRFLEDHGERLESLLLTTPYLLNVPCEDRLDSEDTFWRYLPNLRTIGIMVTYEGMDQFRGPPSGSSVTGLRLFMAPVPWIRAIKVTPRQVQSKLSQLPWVQRLYVDADSFTSLEHTFLQEVCEARSIIYTILS